MQTVLRLPRDHVRCIPFLKPASPELDAKVLVVAVDEERETGEQAEQEADHEEQIAQRAPDAMRQF